MKLYCDVVSTSFHRSASSTGILNYTLLLPNNVTWTKTCATIGLWFVLVEVIKNDNDPGLMIAIGLVPNRSKSSLFETTFSQKMCSIRRWLLVWNVESFDKSFSVKRQILNQKGSGELWRRRCDRVSAWYEYCKLRSAIPYWSCWASFWPCWSGSGCPGQFLHLYWWCCRDR